MEESLKTKIDSKQNELIEKESFVENDVNNINVRNNDINLKEIKLRKGHVIHWSSD